MVCLSTARIAQLQARLDDKKAQLAALNAAYIVALGNSEIEGYTFDSGEGRQQTRRRKLEELSQQIAILEREIDSLQNKIAGCGIYNVKTRRYVR